MWALRFIFRWRKTNRKKKKKKKRENQRLINQKPNQRVSKGKSHSLIHNLTYVGRPTCVGVVGYKSSLVGYDV